MMKKQLLIVFGVLLFVAPLFHNCSQFVSESETLNKACANELLPLFKATYHQFFTNNTCKNCHSPSGLPGVPHFAAPNAALGLTHFMKIGPDRLENKLKTGHQSFNYGNAEVELTTFKDEWNERSKTRACTGDKIMPPSKTIEFFEPCPGAQTKTCVKPSMQDWQTLTWDMDIETDDTEGVEVSIKVKVTYNEFNLPENYMVKDLMIKTPNHPVLVQGVTVMLNRKTYFVTTFQGIDLVIPAGPDFQAVGDSAAAIFVKDETEKYANTDRWAVQFETLEIPKPDEEE